MGNGRATVLRFAEEGAKVMAVDRDLASAQETVAMVKGSSECFAFEADVTKEATLAAAVAAGSQFLVSPGFSAALGDQARRTGVPLLPGVATATELMAALEAGFDTLKFFPAEQAGGVPMLKALFAPFPTVQFCPTGGIVPHKAADYLAQPNVVAIGMSSVAPQNLMEAGEYSVVTALARAAAGLRAPSK